MKAPELQTNDPHVLLVEPDVERDAELGVSWLSGELGHDTLRLMGVNDQNNVPSTLAAEKERVEKFISSEDQLNWMIRYDDQIVGSVWVEMKKKEKGKLLAPSIHIMIGDPTARGKGIGGSSVRTVIEYLKSQGNKTLYTRHLVDNIGATKLLEEQGFRDIDEPYSDPDGLNWQNMTLGLTISEKKL